MMNDSFYSAAAQIIVVLLLALSIERRTYSDLSDKTLYGHIARANQLYVYVWSIIGLSVALLHLADLNIGWLTVGETTVLVSIFITLVLLISTHIMSLQQDKLQKRGYAILSFLFLPSMLNIVISVLLFSQYHSDLFFICIITITMILVTFIGVLINKNYLLEIREILKTHRE